jgi:hypothetical protein
MMVEFVKYGWHILVGSKYDIPDCKNTIGADLTKTANHIGDSQRVVEST